MATEQEKQELIEVLKFTPRTYKVRLWGYGGEYVMGTVDRKIYDYFRERRLSVEEFAWDSDYAEQNDIPKDMWPFDPGSWHDCDNMGHAWGVDRNAGTIQIDDENGDTIWEKQLEDCVGWDENDEPTPEIGGDDEYWIDSQPKGTVVFIGVSSEKGTFFEADLELKMPFDAGKLCLNITEIDGNEIVTSVSYNGVELDHEGGDTNGKSSEFAFYIAGSSENGGKYERYKDMDDIDYELTDWIPGKSTPERKGKYNVETEDGYKYQAIWNGEMWHNDWNQEQIYIKQWQGIAYDPDEHFLREELDNIKVEN